jgi:hypothetical protein
MAAIGQKQTYESLLLEPNPMVAAALTRDAKHQCKEGVVDQEYESCRYGTFREMESYRTAAKAYGSHPVDNRVVRDVSKHQNCDRGKDVREGLVDGCLSLELVHMALCPA